MKIVKELSLVLAINVALLLILEVGTRIYLDARMTYDIEMTRYARIAKIESANPQIGHVHRPNTHAKLMGVDVQTNSYGFRDREYPLEKGSSYRIVFLGDSLTFGWGVPYEETFKYKLERALSEIRPTEIINLGIGNYNTQQELNLFIEKGLQFKPDKVVLFYFINDAEETPKRSRWSVLENSELVSFVWSRLRIIGSMFSKSPSFEDYYGELYRDGAPGWEITKASLRELKQLTGKHGIALQVVILPELHSLVDYPFAKQHAKVLDVLKREGIDALDLTPSFATVTEPSRLWVAQDDAHPNSEAHTMIATFSKSFLAKDIKAP